MKRPVLLAALALAGALSAQRGPLPGMPIVTPVDHPALLAQPLLQPEAKERAVTASSRRARTLPAADADGAKEPVGEPKPEPKPKRPQIDPATVGTKAEGRELKQLVAKVTDLDWGSELFDLEARSAATGKPILWLQSLGDLDGRA